MTEIILQICLTISYKISLTFTCLSHTCYSIEDNKPRLLKYKFMHLFYVSSEFSSNLISFMLSLMQLARIVSYNKLEVRYEHSGRSAFLPTKCHHEFSVGKLCSWQYYNIKVFYKFFLKNHQKLKNLLFNKVFALIVTYLILSCLFFLFFSIFVYISYHLPFNIIPEQDNGIVLVYVTIAKCLRHGTL
jgi:multidrug efflux pump subunit AcrB